MCKLTLVHKKWARGALIFTLAGLFYYIFIPSQKPNDIEYRVNYSVSSNDTFQGIGSDYSPLLQRQISDPIDFKLQPSSSIQIPIFAIQQQTCIYISNYYKEKSGEIVFINSGPVGLQIFVSNNPKVVNAAMNEGNLEYCTLEQVNFDRLSLGQYTDVRPGIFNKFCNSDNDGDCRIEGFVRIHWYTKLLNMNRSIIYLVLVSVSLSTLLVMTVGKYAFEFIMNSYQSKTANSLKHDSHD